jgi:hypothetical protein
MKTYVCLYATWWWSYDRNMLWQWHRRRRGRIVVLTDHYLLNAYSELCRPSDHRLSAKLEPTFVDRGATLSPWQIPTAAFSVLYTGAATFSSKLLLNYYYETEWTPFQTHYFSENLVTPGIGPGTSGSVARNWSINHRGGHLCNMAWIPNDSSPYIILPWGQAVCSSETLETARYHNPHNHNMNSHDHEYLKLEVRDPSRWPRGTLYPQQLALTSPKSGVRSFGTVRSRTQATERY